jgi:hypothetical protein
MIGGQRRRQPKLRQSVLVGDLPGHHDADLHLLTGGEALTRDGEG